MSGRCDRCSKKSEAQRPTAAQRGYGYRWQKTSKARLQRYPFCTDPFGIHGERVVLATCTDHITAHKGDMTLFWDPNNWQSLCDACNSLKAVNEEGGFGRPVELARRG